ncbi:prolipoprotein diacylglyceryl transferase [Demetria terragena]|uniref:prolipoprotein diacylglyceryl transferase n=1 Tax=Demetria terragena TaxID=63959 RepID=UPI0003621DA3|nr:prolipoprotein diacylglyceryl transferase [Demetria terragena]
MIASIPSPTSSVLWLGPIPLRGYALCILAGIAFAIWSTGKRLAARGGDADDALAVAYWSVPFGILGGRLYHVITTPQPYFGENGKPLDAFKIWEGGLGIWGAIALGAVGAWIGCRRYNVRFLVYADAAAPGVAVAQAMGRVGNWFNNELYGEPSDAPWALTIHEMDSGKAVRDTAGDPVVLGTFQPTFLFEMVWLLIVAAVVFLAGRRWSLRQGQSFFLYVLLYPVGRLAIELMRTDPANEILGQRVNVWVSIVVFLGGLAAFLWCRRTQPASPDLVTTPETEDEPRASH